MKIKLIKKLILPQVNMEFTYDGCWYKIESFQKHPRNIINVGSGTYTCEKNFNKWFKDIERGTIKIL